ncbi:hypothetical protein PsorP6_019525 [Peronosclerospora sorghi]|nr:hypothetical protein PsorP6_019525 [Peronosclerospora sorghi]
MKGGSTTSSPKVTQTFFLSEQEKKLLQKIEAVSLLREQLQQTREKDLAFFAGKTANPFFQARAANTKLESQVDERVMVVSGDDDEGVEGMQRRGSRLSKFFPLHPTVQHVFSVCPETERMDTTVAQTKLPLFAPKQMSFTAEKVYDDSETLKTLPNEVIAVLQASLNGQVTTESSFSETFRFREYLDASSFPAPDMKLVDLTLSRSKEDNDAASADFAERETSLVDELVETHGMQENQVRELHVGMEQARAKRGGRERNLTLADRYLPVNARRLVGNREPLHTCSRGSMRGKLVGEIVKSSIALSRSFSRLKMTIVTVETKLATCVVCLY